MMNKWIILFYLSQLGEFKVCWAPTASKYKARTLSIALVWLGGNKYMVLWVSSALLESYELMFYFICVLGECMGEGRVYVLAPASTLNCSDLHCTAMCHTTVHLLCTVALFWSILHLSLLLSSELKPLISLYEEVSGWGPDSPGRRQKSLWFSEDDLP